jgi:hypothetical protein
MEEELEIISHTHSPKLLLWIERNQLSKRLHIDLLEIEEKKKEKRTEKTRGHVVVTRIRRSSSSRCELLTAGLYFFFVLRLGGGGWCFSLCCVYSLSTKLSS